MKPTKSDSKNTPNLYYYYHSDCPCCQNSTVNGPLSNASENSFNPMHHIVEYINFLALYQKKTYVLPSSLQKDPPYKKYKPD